MNEDSDEDFDVPLKTKRRTPTSSSSKPKSSSSSSSSFSSPSPSPSPVNDNTSSMLKRSHRRVIESSSDEDENDSDEDSIFMPTRRTHKKKQQDQQIQKQSRSKKTSSGFTRTSAIRQETNHHHNEFKLPTANFSDSSSSSSPEDEDDENSISISDNDKNTFNQQSHSNYKCEEEDSDDSDDDDLFNAGPTFTLRSKSLPSLQPVKDNKRRQNAHNIKDNNDSDVVKSCHRYDRGYDSMKKSNSRNTSDKRKSISRESYMDTREDNENDDADDDALLNEAFFSTSSIKTSSSNTCTGAADDHNNNATWQQDQEEHQIKVNTTNSEVEVVDLCDDDGEDNDSHLQVESNNKPDTIFHQGLRVPKRSPKFNNTMRKQERYDNHQNSYGDDVHTRNSLDPKQTIHSQSSYRLDIQPPPMQNQQDDIVDCWSSDDDGYNGMNRKKQEPRRVTDTFSPTTSANHDGYYEEQSYQQNYHETQDGIRNNDLSAINSKVGPNITGPLVNNHGNNDWNQNLQRNDNNILELPSAPPLRQQMLPSRWTIDRMNRRRKLRDATNASFARAVAPKDNSFNSNSNHHFGTNNNLSSSSYSCGRRNNPSYKNNQHSSEQATFVQSNSNDNVWYRQSNQNNDNSHPTITTQRNDLIGGSGVGIGSYSFQETFDEQHRRNSVASMQGPARPKSWTAVTSHSCNESTTSSSRRSNNKTKSTKNTKSTRGGRGKKKWGGRRGYYKKKGAGRGEAKQRGRGSSRSARDGGSNEPYMNISRQDPHLNAQHVGGANITF